MIAHGKSKVQKRRIVTKAERHLTTVENSEALAFAILGRARHLRKRILTRSVVPNLL